MLGTAGESRDSPKKGERKRTASETGRAGKALVDDVIVPVVQNVSASLLSWKRVAVTDFGNSQYKTAWRLAKSNRLPCLREVSLT